MKRRNQIILSALALTFLLWLINPLRWWLPRHSRDRSSGTTYGMVEPTAACPAADRRA